MAGERNYLRVPPDSTGKRVRLKHTAQIFYNGLQNNHVWKVGEMYRTTFSDSAVYMVHVHGHRALTADTGILEVHYNAAPTYNNLSPNVGAPILDPDNSTVATVSQAVDIFINSQHIIGYDNPENGVDVDATGSMNVRFSEGLPQLDAFGKLRTSGSTILGEYTFSDSQLPVYFSTTKHGSGTLTHNSDLKCIQLATGTGTATVETGVGANKVQHTTNTYHHYFPGYSQLAIMTVALSNTGEAGVVREWGYNDEKNGYHFRVVGTGGLECVIQSSATGQSTQTVITRTQTKTVVNGVVQSTSAEGWNQDPVNGFGDSGKELVLTSDNIYWIDVQWLGSGRVRFGTYHHGQRVVIHEYYHDTNAGIPHSQTGSLPLRFRQYNIAGQFVANATNMKVWCCSVSTEQDVDLKGQGRGQLGTFEVTFDPSNLNDFKGLSDTGLGDRAMTMKTGVTTSGTTMTVPNLTGIKPGWRVHIDNQNGGAGVLVDGFAKVTEIVNATTIKISPAPSTNLTGQETVEFHMHVDDEYQLVGILSPKQYIGPNNTTSENRTLYMPQAIRTMAYHDDGADAFVEVEIYVDPILSGNDAALPITKAQATGGNAVLLDVEKNDPFCAVVRYENTGRVNYFGRGFHQIATYIKGAGGREELGSQYGNFQAGAFKIRSDDGGNNRCPILKVFQSPAAGRPTTVQINTPPTGLDFSLHREGNAIQFEQIPGLIGTDATYGINRDGAAQTFYLRMTDLDMCELYLDKEYTQPWDTFGLNNSSNANSFTWPGNTGSVPTGGFILSGYGPYLYFAIVAKPIGPSKAGTAYQTAHGNITVHFSLAWNEVN